MIVKGIETETGTEIGIEIVKEIGIVIVNVFVIMTGIENEERDHVKDVVAIEREMTRIAIEKKGIVIVIEREEERDHLHQSHFPELVLHLEEVSVH